MSIQQMFLGAGGGGMEATGGDNVVEYTFGGVDYKVHTFLSDGNFVVTKGGDYEAIIVGGGGGGKFYGGGGGGGGVIHVGAGTGGVRSISADTYPVVVGDGGVYSVDSASLTTSNDGESSTFDGYTATGGGAAGGYNNQAPRAGANGGGNGPYLTTTVQGVIPALPANDTHAVAYGGKTGGTYQWLILNSGGMESSGGGAGAGEDGKTGSHSSVSAQSPHGGDGVQITWATRYALTGAGDTATGLYWGGGGGGYSYNGTPEDAGNGGAGGGGGGNTFHTNQGNSPGTGGSGLNAGGDGVIEIGNNPNNAGDAGANTGGGGGAAAWPPAPGNGHAGSGGSGIVIIRYRI